MEVNLARSLSGLRIYEQKRQDTLFAVMDQSRWQKIEPILDKALTITDQKQQKTFVKKACKSDRKLFKQVTSLLASIREANTENFLQEH